MQITIGKNDNMNVFLYGGKDRFTANEPITENNTPLVSGKTYSIDYKKGFLLVAYPKQEVSTDFEFTYGVKVTEFGQPPEPEIILATTKA